MPKQQSPWITHTFGGGWATDYGKTYYGADQNGTLSLPWLNKAENVQFHLDGRPYKAPGTDNLLVTSGSSIPLTDLDGNHLIRGIFDYWRVGTAGSSSQRIVIACGNEYFSFPGVAGALTRISGSAFVGSSVKNTVPHFSTFNDLLILANGSAATSPQSWDQTTFQSLAGTPPLFSFSTPHQGRHWAAGITTTPSRLHYSAVGNPEDWVGAGSGSIDIDPGDGDEIIGLWSWKNQLWVFKGPNKLSIHRITGSSPSDFARQPFIRGISAGGQNSIMAYGDDIFFWSPRGSLHSLKATDTYGDYAQAYLNYPILSWCRDKMIGINTTFWQSAVDPLRGYGLSNFRMSGGYISPALGQATNNMTMMMDFRFMGQGEPYPRFALWPYLKAHSISYGLNVGYGFLGGDEWGNVYELDRSDGVDGNGPIYPHLGNSIRATIETPYLAYGSPIKTKTLAHVALNLAPDGDYTNTVTTYWGGEKGFNQSTEVTQTFAVPLNTFVLGTDSLGTEAAHTAGIEPMHGDFRTIQYGLVEESVKKVTFQNIMANITSSGESLEA